MSRFNVFLVESNLSATKCIMSDHVASVSTPTHTMSKIAFQTGSIAGPINKNPMPNMFQLHVAEVNFEMSLRLESSEFICNFLAELREHHGIARNFNLVLQVSCLPISV